jgi:hypothetical protein
MSAPDIEALLLQQLDRDGAIADSSDFAAANGWDHQAVVGVIKSLEQAEMIATKVRGAAAARKPPCALQCLCCSLHAWPRGRN